MIFGRCPNDGEPADPAVLPVLLRFREGEQLLQLDEQVAKAVCLRVRCAGPHDHREHAGTPPVQASWCPHNFPLG